MHRIVGENLSSSEIATFDLDSTMVSLGHLGCYHFEPLKEKHRSENTHRISFRSYKSKC